MSYEGHYYKRCCNGHLESYDVHGEEDEYCPVCYDLWEGDKEYHVDETNGLPYRVNFQFILKTPEVINTGHEPDVAPTFEVEVLNEYRKINSSRELYLNPQNFPNQRLF